LQVPLPSEKGTARNVLESNINTPGPDSGPGFAIPWRIARQRQKTEAFRWPKAAFVAERLLMHNRLCIHSSGGLALDLHCTSGHHQQQNNHSFWHFGSPHGGCFWRYNPVQDDRSDFTQCIPRVLCFWQVPAPSRAPQAGGPGRAQMVVSQVRRPQTFACGFGASGGCSFRFWYSGDCSCRFRC